MYGGRRRIILVADNAGVCSECTKVNRCLEVGTLYVVCGVLLEEGDWKLL